MINALPTIMQSLFFLFWLIVWVIATLVLTLYISPSPPVTLLWDIANYLAYFATVLILLLFIYTSQPKPWPNFSGKYFIALHQCIAWSALVLVTLHITVLLIDQPLLLEHIKPTAPWYMLAGVIASLLLVLVHFSSLPAIRKKVYPRYQKFKRLHAGLSVVIVVLVYSHIAGAGFYLNSPLEYWLWLLFFSVALAWPLRLNRLEPRPSKRIPNRQRDAVIHSALLVLLVFSVLLWLSLNSQSK